jgi:hypothetical protein
MRDAPFIPRDNTGTIVCIGGSHTWGGGVEAENRYSDILAKMTNRQVVNAGHASLGIDQICIAILKKLPVLRPKIIIVEQYPWAVVRVANNYVNGFIKPVFSVGNDGSLVLKQTPILSRYALVRSWIGQYYAYRKELEEFRSGIVLSKDYDPFTDPLFMLWKTSYYKRIYVLFEKLALAIQDHCRRNEIKLLFVLGTNRQQIQGTKRSPLIDYDLPSARLGDIFSRNSIKYVDTKDQMLAAHQADDPVIFDDGHINEKGHRVFAGLLADALAKQGWV